MLIPLALSQFVIVLKSDTQIGQGRGGDPKIVCAVKKKYESKPHITYVP
jgi:hypothetical protein